MTGKCVCTKQAMLHVTSYHVTGIIYLCFDAFEICLEVRWMWMILKWAETHEKTLNRAETS